MERHVHFRLVYKILSHLYGNIEDIAIVPFSCKIGLLQYNFKK